MTSKTTAKHETSRRGMLFGAACALALSISGAAPAMASADTAQKIADHFSSVRTMAGEFVQFGPSGEQTGGKFYIERPGKLLFLYEKPSPIRVVADGKSVVVNNKKLDTWEVYPLGKTPLRVLLGDRIDLSGSVVRSVKEANDLTTIVIDDKQVFGDSQITMMFDPATYDLRQWTVRDAQGKDTTVMIFNVQQGVRFGDDTFDIPYRKIHEAKRSSN